MQGVVVVVVLCLTLFCFRLRVVCLRFVGFGWFWVYGCVLVCFNVVWFVIL